MPYYLGKRPQGDWVLFAFTRTPTQETHSHLYACAQGSFRTSLAARWYNRYSWGNPHGRTVADAERLALEGYSNCSVKTLLPNTNAKHKRLTKYLLWLK